MKTLKKPLSFLLALIMLASVLFATPFDAFAADTNTHPTAEGEFTEISTAAQLMDVINVHKNNDGSYQRQRVKLMNDITIDTTGLGSSFRDSNERNQRFFNGIFDGNNHIITVKSDDPNAVLEPLFDQIDGKNDGSVSLSETETLVYNLNLVYKNDVYGAPFANEITSAVQDTQPNYHDINVTFKNVIPIAGINSNRTCACGFACVTDVTKYKNISVSGKNIGNLDPANSAYVLASGFTSSYSNTQSFWENISVKADNIQGCAGTDAGVVCVTGLMSLPTVVGGFYRDISIDVKNNIEAKGVSGSNAGILACGVSLSSQYFYNAEVKVGGDISALGYAHSSPGGIDCIGAFGISYDLRSNSTNDTILDKPFFPKSFKNLNDMGTMSVEVGGDIKSETLGNGNYPTFTSAAGASFQMANYVPFNDTTINVTGNISAKSEDSYTFSAGLSNYADNKTFKRADKHFSVEDCTINAGSILSEGDSKYVFVSGAFTYLSFPCKDVEVNVNSIIGKSLNNYCLTAGFAYYLSPEFNYGGSTVALDNCSVHAKTITTTAPEDYANVAGLVVDATDTSYTDTIQNCTVEVTDELSSSLMVEMSLFLQLNKNSYKLFNNAAIIPSNYSAIYSKENQDPYFKSGNGIESADSNKYVKFTLLESSDRSKNTYEINNYDNWNDWENSNTVTIGDKSYKTVCAYTDNSVTGNNGYNALWQLQEIDNSFKFHVNEPGKADRLFRVYNGDASTAEDPTEYSLTNGTVEAFYAIPAFAEDDYVFAGWYYNSSDGKTDGNTPFEFGEAIPSGVTDVYAHWIPVGEVDKDENDDKILPEKMNGKYKGFELFGVQIRPEANFDHNLGDYTNGGLRFVTSISEALLASVDALSDKTVDGKKVEYGFVTASEENVKEAMKNLGIQSNASYKLQYRGVNVNGVDTIMENKSKDERKNKNNFRYVTNVDCTSKVGGYGKDSRVKIDHRNYENKYRLATFVIQYDDNESNKTEKVVARAYMRYYDANGLLRTFYNDYGGTSVYGGCSTSFAAVKGDRTDPKELNKLVQ